MPARYRSLATRSSRCYRWRSQGIWQEILNRLQQAADAANQIDARSTFYRQYHRPRSRSTQGEQKGGTECRRTIAECRASSAARSTRTLKRRLIRTKIHIQAEGMGKPMQFVLTEGQRSDVKGFSTLNTALKVKRSRRGKPKLSPRYLIGDKGACRTDNSQYLTPSAHHTSHPQAQEGAKYASPASIAASTESATALNACSIASSSNA